MSEPTLAGVGEFGLLDELLPTLPGAEQVLVGPGDDAAIVELGGAAAISCDVLVERVHFRLDWSSARELGRKAVAVNVADIEAMGLPPIALVMGFSAPGDTTLAWIRQFFAGVVAECATAGVALVGGDTTSSRDVTIAVTVLGQTAGLSPVRRSGARPGDVVAVRGQLGYAAAGLAALRRGFRSPRAVVERQRCPEPPYGAGVEANRAGATALIDVSDGLVADLGHVAQASRVGIDVDSAALTVGDPLQAVAAATGADALGFVLTGGEDHALAGTFPAGAVPPGWDIVGKVTQVPDAGPAVTVDGRAWDGAAGWDHFR